MSVLSAATQKQVEDKLVADGLISAEKLAELKKKSETELPDIYLACARWICDQWGLDQDSCHYYKGAVC